MAPFKFRKNIVIGDKECMVYSDKESDKAYFSFQEHSNVIMQFTGLFDKNNNEIYENDILKINSDLYIVSWDYINAQFILENVKSKKKHNNFREMIKNAEIIGNLAETNELFK